MESKFDSVLFKLDILGPEPKLNVFGDDKYKSKFSSICSIIVIALLVAWTIYSIVDYFEYQNPTIVYFKDNDKETNRTVNIQDSIMFTILDISDDAAIDESKIYFEALYIIQKSGSEMEVIPLTVERCEIGKNVDKEFEEQLSGFRLEQYYCIAENLTDLPLNYIPDAEQTSLYISIRLNESSDYEPDEDLFLYFMNGNDIIDHSDNENPFRNTYYTVAINEIVNNKYNIFRYYLQYIKYESDKGLLFDRTHLYTAKSYSHSVVMRTSLSEDDDNEIGAMIIEISNINFDYYNRSYSRIQTLLAEILSVVELLTEIGSMVCGIALNKKMSRKVIKHILHKNSKVNIENDDKNTLDNSNAKTTYLDNQIQVKETNNNLNISAFNTLEKPPSNYNEEKVIKALDHSNYFHFLKSYLCFKDPNTLLINECHEQYQEEVCIENILKRIYDSEERIDCIEAILNENNLQAKNTPKSDHFEKIIELVDKLEKKNVDNPKT